MAVKQEATEAVEAEPKKKKKKGFKILIIVLLVLVLSGLAFTGYAFLTSSFFFAPEDGEEGTNKIIKETMYPLSSFVINLDADGARRYLKISIAIGCADKGDVKKITKKELQIRDSIISTLRNQDIEIISSADQEDLIKNELIKNINTLFEPDLEINIYYTEYIIQ